MRLISRNLTINILAAVIFVLLGASCSSDDGAVDSTDDVTQTDDGPIDNPDDGSTDTGVLDDSKNLGVNFNEQLNYIDNDRLLALKTTWVRGFLDYFRYYEDPSLLNTDDKITKYLTLHTYGFKTVLNIKFLYRNRDYPEQNSAEMQNQMDFLEDLLDRVWDKTDIIVVGNEPIIETDPEDRNDSMFNYYVEAANTVKNYADANGDKPIFFGAFDNMYQSNRQDLQVVNDLLTFSSTTPWIAGVDMHIHHSSTEQMVDALDYVNARIRSDQKIMVTEFSLKKHFKNQLTGIIPEAFASEYGFSADLQNYEYIDYALKNQVEREQWVDFLSQSPWFENRKNYLSNSFYDVFSTYDKFFMAAYAFRQSFPFNANFTANTDPWILNGMYANRTVEPDPDTGQFQFNYAWPEDFISIQNNAN
ncbi:hypothetical protein NE848_02860 [Gramella jeungdoensis]|uniref:Glycoside hydrolase family 5 domain-containing protein n=1 Tax=Gramella jeungdoensis TaxID=708091 RepID=A0ABT0YXW9_9FLAO|nr:hypothetical protein [Gramella jeungdoensis]MCM8568301.1 hypothetical protein [Gramella jeungdoensis]